MFNKSIDEDFNNGINITTISPDSIPLEFVKSYLRVEHDFDDVEIMLALASAQAYIRDYTQTPDDALMDFGLLNSVLVLTAFFYENKTPNIKTTEKLDDIFKSTLFMYKNEVL